MKFPTHYLFETINILIQVANRLTTTEQENKLAKFILFINVFPNSNSYCPIAPEIDQYRLNE